MTDEKINNKICMNLREFCEWCRAVITNDRYILFTNIDEDNPDNDFTCGYSFFFNELTVGVYTNRIQLKCSSGSFFTMNKVKYIISQSGPYDDEIMFTVVCGNLKNDIEDVRYNLIAVNKNS